MSSSDPTEAVRRIMEDFAERTGLSSPAPQARYLWTDAFAVCNYLTLFRRTGDARYRDLAVLLIDSVHHVLGRHRQDDPRQGWISGLPAQEGERHPTAGGLRIGKPLNERGAHEAHDPALEWDRDGQYYHYLTRWIHALGQAGHALGDHGYHIWACELVEAAHSGFVYATWPGGPRQLRWKMSIDLTRPLVAAEGAHDALDGLVSSSRLRARWPAEVPYRGELEPPIAELAEMCADRTWATEDPLGAGGLLMDACWAAGLSSQRGPVGDATRSLVARLWEDSSRSVAAVTGSYRFDRRADGRLAFRELGLAIGLLAVAALSEEARAALGEPCRAAVEEVRRHMPLAAGIVSEWSSSGAQEAASWTAHENINAVMLATALAPDEYLDL